MTTACGWVNPRAVPVAGQGSMKTTSRFFSRSDERFARLRGTAVQACLNIGLILALIVWLYAATWIPTGDPAKDRVLRPRSDFMAFYASGVLIRQSPAQLYDLDRQAETEKAATGLDITREDA